MKLLNDVIVWMTLNIDYNYLIGVLFIFLGFVAKNDNLNKLGIARENRWAGYESNITETTLKWRRQLGSIAIIGGIVMIIVTAVLSFYFKNSLIPSIASLIVVSGIVFAFRFFRFTKLFAKPGVGGMLEYEGIKEVAVTHKVPRIFYIVSFILTCLSLIFPAFIFGLGKTPYIAQLVGVLYILAAILCISSGLVSLYGSWNKAVLIKINAFFGIQSSLTPLSITLTRIGAVASIIVGILLFANLFGVIDLR